MRKGENIRKRKDGRWEARYFNEDKQKYVSIYAKTYTEVKEKINKARSNYSIVSNKNSLNIENIFVIWLCDIKTSVKSSTYSRYYDIVYNHIIPQLGKIKLKDINQNVINAFIKEKRSNGRIDGNGSLSSKTIQDIVSILRQCLKKNNLFFEYKTIQNSDSKEIKILTDYEYIKLINYLMLDTTNEKLGLLIALFCGIRLGELCALTFGDIDFDNGTIYINKTIQRIRNTDSLADTKTIIIIDTPKSQKSIRIIPLPSFLLGILQTLRKSDDSYILTGIRKKYIEPRLLQNKFKAHLKNCNIQDTNFHVLRHTFATKCIELNFDLKTLSEILGHTDVKFTMNRYVHSTMKQKRLQMEKLTVQY